MGTIKNFLYINSFLVSISLFKFYFNYFWVSCLIRNCVLMFFIYYGTKNKKIISVGNKTTFKDILYFCSSTLVQSSTEQLIQNGVLTKPFFFKLVLFELILDLLHYTSHRLSHHFYYFHKTHHHYPNPCLINTYYHHPIDLILIECVPTIICFWLIPFSPFQIELVLVYKSFIEISGHNNKQVAPSSCFPLCIWLPKLFGIELYTEDHNLHHSQSNCNYSKRFNLWDRLFGTFYCIQNN